MSNFVERLKEFMRDTELHAIDIERKTEIDHGNISDFLQQKHQPSYGALIKLVCLFDCSADYLLGIVDIPTEEKLLPVLPFGKRLREILKLKGISQEKMKKDMKISSSVIYNWISGKREPTPTSLIKIANYLDCSVDYLIGRLR